MKNICKLCGEEKEIELFVKDKKCPKGVLNLCNVCRNKHDRLRYKTDQEYKNNRTNINRKSIFSNIENYKKWIIRSIKRRCKINNIPFNLTVDDIVIPDKCPVLGITLVIGQKRLKSSKHYDNNPSVDRIIPSLGYVKGNVKVISYRANRLKSDASLTEVENIASYMRKELQNV